MDRLTVPLLEKSKSVITQHHYDNYNFLYCILRSKFPHYKNMLYTKLKTKFFYKFNLSNLEFPITPSQLGKFMEQNDWLDIKLCVLNLFENKFYPNQVLGTGKQRICVVFNRAYTPYRAKFPGDMGQGHELANRTHFHFFLVKNPDALLSSTFKNDSSYYSKNFFCLNCFCKYSNKKTREEHELLCVLENQAQKIQMPEKEKAKTTFKNFKSLTKMPIVAYCDLESALIKLKNKLCFDCQKELCCCEASVTTPIERHEPLSWSIVFVSSDKKVIHEETFTGKNCITKFMEMLRRLEPLIKSQLQQYKIPLRLTPEEQKNYDSQNICWICEERFNEFDSFDINKRKVIDHNHFSSEFLGAAHANCNLKRRTPEIIPIFFHGKTMQPNIIKQHNLT